MGYGTSGRLTISFADLIEKTESVCRTENALKLLAGCYNYLCTLPGDLDEEIRKSRISIPGYYHYPPSIIQVIEDAIKELRKINEPGCETGKMRAVLEDIRKQIDDYHAERNKLHYIKVDLNGGTVQKIDDALKQNIEG